MLLMFNPYLLTLGKIISWHLSFVILLQLEKWGMCISLAYNHIRGHNSRIVWVTLSKLVLLVFGFRTLNFRLGLGRASSRGGLQGCTMPAFVRPRCHGHRETCNILTCGFPMKNVHHVIFLDRRCSFCSKPAVVIFFLFFQGYSFLACDGRETPR